MQRVLHTVGSLGINAGGPSRTVPALCESVLSDADGFDVQIITTEGGRFGSNIVPDRVPVRAIRHNAPLSELIEFLIASFKTGENRDGLDNMVLHDHGQWLALNRASATVARKIRIPRIVSPRGMLSPWALRHRRWKKMLAWYWFARRDFHHASVLHATSQLEADELRNLGARQPIAVIPNGVEYRPVDDARTLKAKTVLFLSRIHEVKGVRELVSAWRAMKPAGWELVLAGPDESNLIGSLALRPADSIKYVGEVAGEQKWQLLEQASIFILPSYSENFGVVVAEALMAGTPVITTQGTPWQSLIDRDCGWWIPMTADSLQRTLRMATSLDDSTLAAMGKRGHQHAIESFGWPSIGKQMADVYRWMLGQEERPACVQLK